MGALTAAVGLVAWAAAAAGQVWISKDGQTHALAGTPVMMIEDDGGQRFDLADLGDGETRTFGQGDKQLTATRSGDEVVLSRPARGDEAELRVTCRLSSDQCAVVTFDDEPQKVMLIVQKSRECLGDDAECEGDVDVLSGVGGPGAHVIVHKVECEGADCREVEEELGGTVKIMRAGGESSSRVSLRCPKGDTTMRVERAEADKTYLCPKHSLPLEKAKTPAAGTVRVIHAE